MTNVVINSGDVIPSADPVIDTHVHGENCHHEPVVDESKLAEINKIVSNAKRRVRNRRKATRRKALNVAPNKNARRLAKLVR